jgi:hypothetical protein
VRGLPCPSLVLLLLLVFRVAHDQTHRYSPFSYADRGECYVGQSRPRLFALHLPSGTVKAVEGIPEDMAVGQVQMSPASSTIVFTGWNSLPQRLGMIYCYQRPCSLYALDIAPLLASFSFGAAAAAPTADVAVTAAAGKDNTGGTSPTPAELLLLTPSDGTARHPRFDREGRQLLYAASEALPTHGVTSKLKLLTGDAPPRLSLLTLLKRSADLTIPLLPHAPHFVIISAAAWRVHRSHCPTWGQKQQHWQLGRRQDIGGLCRHTLLRPVLPGTLPGPLAASALL